MTQPSGILRGHRGAVLTLLSDDAKHANIVVSGGEDGTCRLWDVRTAKAARCLHIKRALAAQLGSASASDSAVNALAFGAANAVHQYLYAASGNAVLTFDLRQDGMILDAVARPLFADNGDEINALAIHPSKQNKYLAAADDNGDVCVFDVDAHRLFKRLSGEHTNLCMAAPFRPQAPWDLVSGGMDCCLLFWDFSRGRVKFRIDLASGTSSVTHRDPTNIVSTGEPQVFNPPLVHSVAFAANGKSLAAGLGDGAIAVIDFASKAIVRRLNGHAAAVSQVHFPVFQRDAWLLSSGNDAKICVWDYAQAIQKDGHDIEITEPVKHFMVHDKPNAMTTCVHQNFVWVADMSSQIAGYQLL